MTTRIQPPACSHLTGSISHFARYFTKGRRKTRSRRGAAVVEFAVVAPILILLIMGMIECGRMIMVQQILTNASREGARRAVLEAADVGEVNSVVNEYLASTSVTGASVTIDPTSLSTLGFGDRVTVTISVPFDDVSWLPVPKFFGENELSATTVMNAERPE